MLRPMSDAKPIASLPPREWLAKMADVLPASRVGRELDHARRAGRLLAVRHHGAAARRNLAPHRRRTQPERCHTAAGRPDCSRERCRRHDRRAQPHHRLERGGRTHLRLGARRGAGPGSGRADHPARASRTASGRACGLPARRPGHHLPPARRNHRRAAHGGAVRCGVVGVAGEDGAGLHVQLLRARHLAAQGGRARPVRVGREIPQGRGERERGHPRHRGRSHPVCESARSRNHRHERTNGADHAVRRVHPPGRP